MVYQLGKVYKYQGEDVTYRGNVAGVLNFTRSGKPVLELIPDEVVQQVSEVLVADEVQEAVNDVPVPTSKTVKTPQVKS
jgi:metal-sulfur cluster biosynthetic enzyme